MHFFESGNIRLSWGFFSWSSYGRNVLQWEKEKEWYRGVNREKDRGRRKKAKKNSKGRENKEKMKIKTKVERKLE